MPRTTAASAPGSRRAPGRRLHRTRGSWTSPTRRRVPAYATRGEISLRLAARAAITLFATVEPVPSAPAENQIAASPAQEGVVPGPAKQAVRSAIAKDFVDCPPAIELVGSASSPERVNPTVAARDVVAAACRDVVGATSAYDH